jgi:myo-inositol-hexaphosphate 3-phosphohydrolase
VSDFFNAPDIKNVDLNQYSGCAGDEIHIIVSDDFMVKTVKVGIINPDGHVVEEGEAMQDANNVFLWKYIATQNNENTDGNKIIVSVSDLPGNVTVEEEV